jgi:hypothetical protein
MIGFLAGKIGNDTACDYIVEKYGYTKMSFADNPYIQKLIDKNKHNGLIVWSDVRSHNEKDYIRLYGGFIVKIDIPDTHDINYQSEITIDCIENCGSKILNYGGLDEFYKDIDWIMTINKQAPYLLRSDVVVSRRI